MPAQENAIEVPYEQLAPDTLRRVAEEFVTRDGTDYGLIERTLEQKVEALLHQLRSGRAKLYFETETQSIQIVPTQREGTRA